MKYLITRGSSIRDVATIQDERGDRVFAVRSSSPVLGLILRLISFGGIVAIWLLLNFLPESMDFSWAAVALLMLALGGAEALLRSRVKLIVLDEQQTRRGSIRSALLRPRWTFYLGEIPFARLIRERSAGGARRYRVELPGQTPIAVVGDFENQRYSFSQENNLLASVSNYEIKQAASYNMEIADGLDPLPLLAMAVTIDQRARGGSSAGERWIGRLP